RYQVEFRKVVATDIDRDGDVDVLATTDRSLTVWVNDGVGHLTSQRQESDPAIDSQPRSNTCREQDERSQPSANTYVPTTAMPAERAHAPPVLRAENASLSERSLS